MNKLNTMDNFKYRPIKELITFAKVFHDTDDCIEYVLSEFEKSKQLKPILTTEDGEEIYEGAACSIIALPSYHISTCLKFDSIKHPNQLYFSTKEKAEEYKLLNQPCLSVNDIIDKYKTQLATQTLIDLKDLASKKQNTHTVKHKQ